jgi:hypothetical protein
MVTATITKFIAETPDAPSEGNPGGYAAFEYTLENDDDVSLIATITVPMCCFLDEHTNLATTAFSSMVVEIAHSAPDDYASLVGRTFD